MMNPEEIQKVNKVILYQSTVSILDLQDRQTLHVNSINRLLS